ncbi:LytTR family DNA-binding domain-containing protein [Reichenbachiella sp. MALMAid0571]|uniref:LytR/AlgR family response regulator transcription factor n=1 Tax=Reichenbachiella sp. MALMAid0571 TaxID=3143939 RepID=UPI0032DFDB3A
MKCIIVDDDEMARISLSMLCEKIDDITIVESFDNGLDALNWLKNEDIDLVFLDIEMPDLSGMELVKSVDDLPQIIFTTSHSKYALEAFEYQVTDFLPKPIQLGRLLKGIERAKELNDNVSPQEVQSQLFVRVDGKFVRIELDEIMYIESLGDYVRFYSQDGKKYIVHSTIKNIDQKITNVNFLKVHRSYVVNLTKIIDIEDTNLLIKDKVIPVSRAHKPILMNKIKTL